MFNVDGRLFYHIVAFCVIFLMQLFVLQLPSDGKLILWIWLCVLFVSC